MISSLTSHSLQAWLFPPGINILICLLGLVFLNRRYYLSLGLIFFSIFSLWLASAPFTAYPFIDSLQNQYPMLNTDLLPKADAIVVLGGGEKVELEYNKKHAISDSTYNRLRFAAYLYQKLNIPLVLSGGSAQGWKETEATLMAERLQNDFKVKVYLIEDSSLNTAEESKLLAPILARHHFKTIYLVTNAWHMPRSMFAFEREGIHALPAPMGYIHYEPDYTSVLTYFPNIDALQATTIAFHEYFGLLWYFFATR